MLISKSERLRRLVSVTMSSKMQQIHVFNHVGLLRVDLVNIIKIIFGIVVAVHRMAVPNEFLLCHSHDRDCKHCEFPKSAGPGTKVEATTSGS